jgi:electron transfer flavoprotein beta subunit
VLWAAVAERLRCPYVSQATEVRMQDGTVQVVRQTEFGDDTIDLPFPALISVSDAINEPRYASLKGRMGAKKKPLEVLSLADLGIDPSEAGDAGSKTEVLAFGEPPARANSRKIEDEGGAAQAILDFLVEKQLV